MDKEYEDAINEIDTEFQENESNSDTDGSGSDYSNSEKSKKRVKLPRNDDIALENEREIEGKSKFFNRFDEIKSGCLEELEIYNESDEISKTDEQNEYYSLECLRIFNQYMYLMPLWSGVMLDGFEKNKSRVDNNPVENYFKITKHSTLKKSNKMPHEICSKIQLKIRAASIKYDLSGKNYLNELAPMSFCEDVWVDKKKSRKNKKTYYSRVNLKKPFDFSKEKNSQKRRRSKRSVQLLSNSINKMSLGSDSNFENMSEASANDDVFVESTTKKDLPENYLINLRAFQMNVPPNSCTLKLKTEGKVKKDTIKIINSCTIDYFLLSLWTSFELAKTNFKAEIEALRKSNDTYSKLMKIIEKIEAGDWSLAKYIWLNECLGLKPDDRHELNCKGNIHALFIKKMFELQKYFFIKKSCTSSNENLDDLNEKDLICSFSFEYLNNLQNLKPECQNQCGSCFWKTVKFKQTPLWIITDFNDTKDTNIKDLPIYLEFDKVTKYRLVCAYSFHKAEPNELDHFKGIFYLNSFFYLVDDLHTNQIKQITDNYEFRISCLIYFKKY